MKNTKAEPNKGKNVKLVNFYSDNNFLARLHSYILLNKKKVR